MRRNRQSFASPVPRKCSHLRCFAPKAMRSASILLRHLKGDWRLCLAWSKVLNSCIALRSQFCKVPPVQYTISRASASADLFLSHLAMVFRRRALPRSQLLHRSSPPVPRSMAVTWRTLRVKRRALPRARPQPHVALVLPGGSEMSTRMWLKGGISGIPLLLLLRMVSTRLSSSKLRTKIHFRLTRQLAVKGLPLETATTLLRKPTSMKTEIAPATTAPPLDFAALEKRIIIENRAYDSFGACALRSVVSALDYPMASDLPWAGISSYFLITQKSTVAGTCYAGYIYSTDNFVSFGPSMTLLLSRLTRL